MSEHERRPAALASAALATLAVGLLACSTPPGVVRASAAPMQQNADAQKAAAQPNGLASFFGPPGRFDNAALLANVTGLLEQGRQVFRYDTFGDEAFWGGQLELNQAIAGAKNGGIGPGISPSTALQVGLKVDIDALPANVIQALAQGKVDLNDPAVTLSLLELNSVVGVKGVFDHSGNLASVGITCAICHSTVDDSFAPGIGHRLDGWPNQDLNVGVIISLAPNLQPFADELGVDQATVRKVLTSWGPGMFNAELNLDGKAFKPDGTPYVTRIPAAYGHVGESEHTWTASFGDVTYWNAYVANLEMHGIGNFNDSRLDDPAQYPVAARTGQGHVRHQQDLITPKLAALQYYQLSLPAPKPPPSSYAHDAAAAGKLVFDGQGGCADCHMPTQLTDAGFNVHTAQELCIDNLQGSRGPSGGGYVTPQLAGLWARSKRGFYHDGRFPTLQAVVEHYNQCMNLKLTSNQENDLVQYLKSL